MSAKTVTPIQLIRDYLTASQEHRVEKGLDPGGAAQGELRDASLGQLRPAGHRLGIGNGEPRRRDRENPDRTAHVLRVEFTQLGRR